MRTVKLEWPVSHSMASHILNLLHRNERTEEYYGNKEQYWKRHKKLKTLFELLEKDTKANEI